MKLEQDVCNGSKRKQIYKCDWLWQTGYYAKTKRKGERGMREGWEYKKLGEIINVRTGKLDANASSEDGQYPFFTCSREPLRISSYSYDCECVLVAGNGDLNVKYYNGKFDAYQRTYIIILKEGITETSVPYLYKFFTSYIEVLRQRSIGGIIKYIKLGDITNAILPLPPLSMQETIVSELDKINELIRLKKEQLKDYDNLAQSIFYEMFGDEKYERRKLKDIVKVKSGQVSPLEDPYCDMVHVGPANIESNTGRLINLKTAKEENLISGKYLFDSSMVLYSKIRPNLNKVTIADFEGICSADMYPLIPSKSIDKKFLLFILKQKEFLSYAIANSGRANIPKINREALLEYSTILPPLSLQLQFAERLALIEKQKEQISSIIKDLETLLASRMQYWFD